MSNPTRCTHCVSLLKNCKAFEKSHYYSLDNEMYIDVEDYTYSEIIAAIQEHQEETYKLYNNLIKLTEKEA